MSEREEIEAAAIVFLRDNLWTLHAPNFESHIRTVLDALDAAERRLVEVLAERDRLADAITEVVTDLGSCTYLAHDGDRSVADLECPGTWCYLILTLTSAALEPPQ